MGKRKWILPAILILVLGIFIFLLSNNSKKASIEERDNVLEFGNIGNYTVFIERSNHGESSLKLYNRDTKLEELIEGVKGNLYGLKISPDEKYFVVDEGTSIVKTTYIVPIEDMENMVSLRTIGQVVFSPDSTKLLIGVENNKKRAIETELKGTVDLALYYINSRTVEPLIEADEYTDYEAIDWDEEDNISYKKIVEGEEEELTVKYELSTEEQIMAIIQLEEDRGMSNIMELLSTVDFHKFEDLYGESSVLELLRWLGKQDIEGEEDILILIKLMDEFIGQEYFAYIQSIANSFLNHKIQFIKALAQVPETLEDVGYALNNMRVYDIEGQDMWEDLDMITDSEELTENERKIGIELIHFYSACST